MAVIDDKVVAMSFESRKFEEGIGKSITALDKLKAALHFPHAGKAITEIGAASKAVDLGHIAKGIEGVKQSLSTFRLTSIAVFAEVAKEAIATGTQIVKAFTIEPAKLGFSEYSTNLNAVQTILANTAAAGATIKDVNKALDELNTYSDKTIYNFSQMARNIGTFTAAGVDLKTATMSIKGIANLAALSGSNAEQASTAMYQLSQAISAGAVKLMDWNSVVNAGMGGTVFQRALAQTAEHMGKLKEGTVQLVGPMKNVKIAGESFRNSLSAPGKDSWLTSDVLTTTLKMFTSDLTDAELRADGWNEAQIKAIQAQAKTAMLAATNVKTLQQVLQVAKETAGSGWAKTWQIVFGDFEEAKKTFTSLSNAINGVIIDNARARNNLLADWKALGGRTVLINGIKIAFQNLSLILKPIKQAFRDIFPATTAQDLMRLTRQFVEFAEALKPSVKTMFQIRHTFAGLFAVLDIGWEIIKGVVGVFRDLIGATSAGSGGFLSFTNNMGNALVAFHKWLIEGGRLAKFFDGLTAVLKAPITLLQKLAGVLKDFFSGLSEGFSSGGISDNVSVMTRVLEGLKHILSSLAEVWDRFVDSFSGSSDIFGNVAESIGKGIAQIGVAIGQAAAQMNFEPILAVIRTGLLAGMFLMFKKFFGKGTFSTQLAKGFAGIGGGLLKNISGSFKALQGSLTALQQNIKAKTLKEIAIAVALLAASMVALSFIDPKKLSSALGAMTVAFGELLGAMAILTAVTRTMGFIKLPVIAGSLILLAGAIDLLSLAVVVLAQLSWGELLRGLTGVGVLLGIIAVAIVPLSANSAGLIRAGIGITALAIGLRILASAVKALSQLSLQELAKGLGAIAVSLVILVVATNKIPSGGMIGIGIGLMAVAVALRIMAEAVKAFGGMDLRTLGQGLGAIGASLVIIGLAMKLMPKSMLITGAGLILVSVALQLIAKAIESMGGMSIREIAKGLIALGGAMLILGVAMHAMSGAVGGALALGVVAASLALLVPVLITLGKQSWGTIIKSMIALAAGLALLAGASILLAEAIPLMIGLGVALVLIGGGIALAGAGLFLISAALSALVVALPSGVGILIAALVELTEGLIDNAKLLALGLLEVVRAFAATAPKFVEALIVIIDSLIDGLIKILPKVEVLITALVQTILDIFDQNQDEIVQSGLSLLLALLQGIKNNIGLLVTAVGDIIVRFINALGNNMNKIVRAGLNLLVKFLEGIANNYVLIVTSVLGIITRFVSAIGSNLGKIATAGLSILTKLLGAIASNIGDVITAGTNLIVAMVRGIGNAAGRIVTAAREAAGKFINTLANQIVVLADEVFTAMITLINGLATVIENRAPELRTAGLALGKAIISGMTGGLTSAAGDLYAKASEIAHKALDIIKKPWNALSPSRTMMDLGKNIIDGMTVGLDKNASNVYSSATAVSNGVIKSFKDPLQIASPSKVMIELGKAVGQGFAQGIRSSAEDIKNAFAEMDKKLTDQMVTSREIIVKEQKKLDELRASKKPDAKAIAEAQAVIKENQDLLARSTAGHILLTKALRDEKAELISLSNDYERIGTKLEEAKTALADLRQQRADYQQSLIDQYSTAPDISGPLIEEIASARGAIAQEQAKLNEELAKSEQDPEQIASAQAAVIAAQLAFDKLIAGKTLNAEGTAVDQLATYVNALKTQTDTVTAYQSTLQQLRKLGLDDVTYQKLLKEGPADQAFANQLLAGGRTAVKSLNTLDANLLKVSKTLATNAATNLYQAGIKSAQGLLNGLKSQHDEIRKEMEEIARMMVASLKKELKQKSPSQVFAEIGRFSMEGLALGFKQSSNVVTDAVVDAGKDALTAMKNTISNISDIVMDELNPQPVITPILDLTQVRAQGEELAGLTKVVPITAAASYGQASLISADQATAQVEQTVGAPGGTSVKFEQNNYSPESLTEIEIYRQTKNQLSQLKSVLAIT